MFLYVCLFCLLPGSLQLDECRSFLNVRLQGTKYAGRLEVCYPSQWRNHFWMPVCDDNWSNVDAGVVCRQLNFTNPAYQGLYTKAVCLSVCPYVHLSVCLSVCMYVHLSVSLSGSLTVCMSGCLSV